MFILGNKVENCVVLRPNSYFSRPVVGYMVVYKNFRPQRVQKDKFVCCMCVGNKLASYVCYVIGCSNGVMFNDKL